MQESTGEYSAVEYSAANISEVSVDSAVRNSTVQFSTLQYSTVHYRFTRSKHYILTNSKLQKLQITILQKNNPIFFI